MNIYIHSYYFYYHELDLENDILYVTFILLAYNFIQKDLKLYLISMCLPGNQSNKYLI